VAEIYAAVSLAGVIEPPVPELQPPYRTDERIALQAEARRFARDEVLPVANECDPHKREMPRSLLDALGTQGYFGIMIPAEYGGMGRGVFEYAMIAEELARAWMSVGSIIARGQGLGTEFDDEEKQRRLLQRSARGDWIGAAGLSEPDAGSDLAAVSTSVEPDGSDYIINGRKRWIGNAKAADFIQLLVRTEEPGPDDKRSAGLATVILEKERDSFPSGLTGEPIDKIGYHGFVTWDLTFDGVRVPKANRSRATSTTSPSCAQVCAASCTTWPPNSLAAAFFRLSHKGSTRTTIGAHGARASACPVNGSARYGFICASTRLGPRRA